ncbi:MAG TPA: proton-conducting transporter membrane subunit [Polyangia bacterium]
MNAADTLWVKVAHAQPDAWLWTMLAFPLLGAIVCGLFGRSIERRGPRGPGLVAGIAVAVMVGAALSAVAAFLRLRALPVEDRLLVDHLFTLLKVERLHVDVAFALDPLSAVFALVITIVGTLIHGFSVGYMHGDPGRWRFFACLNLFVFAMLLLGLGASRLLCFVGWEGVGLCSYLLIGFWHRETGNVNAAKKAFLFNRVGDWGFVAGMMLLVALFAGTLPLGPDLERRLAANPPTLVAPIPHAGESTSVPAEWAVPLAPTLRLRDLDAFVRAQDADGVPVVAEALRAATLWGVPLVFLIGLGFFLAMAGKSAQLPLALWLPDAMAGPTPVSALIHAATMVTAGVDLAARLSFLVGLSPGLGTLIALIGLTTALVAALIAVVQHDIKRLLAYSTISQLGFMFVAVGAGANEAAVFHVVTHACFKACLFLAAGVLIHAQADRLGAAVARRLTWAQRRLQPDPADPQDFRNMRGLREHLPLTRLGFLVGAVALAGLPVASGFFSKDEMLWRVLTAGTLLVSPTWIYGAALLAAGLTAFYSARGYFLAFGGERGNDAGARPGHDLGQAEGQGHSAHEPVGMVTVVLILAVAAIVIGPLLGWPAAWGGHPWLEHFLAPTAPAPDAATFAGARRAQIAGVLVASLGWLFGWMFARRPQIVHGSEVVQRPRWDGLHRLLWNGLHLDDLARALTVHPVEDFSRAADAADRRWVDGLVRFVARATLAISRLGGFIDRYVVDGLVRAVGEATLWSGRRLQRVQTGRINHYTLGITVGAALLVIVAWIAQ